MQSVTAAQLHRVLSPEAIERFAKTDDRGTRMRFRRRIPERVSVDRLLDQAYADIDGKRRRRHHATEGAGR